MEPLPVPNDLSPGRCPRCGAILLEKASFCGKCGNSTINADETSPANDFDSYKQRTSWQWVSRAIGLWIALLAINGVLGLLGHVLDLSSPYYDLGAQVLSAFLILAVFSGSGINILPLLRNAGSKGIRPYFGALVGLIGMYIFMYLYFRLASALGLETLSYLADYQKHQWPLWSAFILICLFPGIFEELAFRGFIMSSFEKVGGYKEALIVQAAMFSVLHMLPGIFISHFVMGLVLGVLRQKSRSLYPGMFFHASWNAIVLLKEIFG